MKITVGGADALHDLARKLHDAADKNLTQELHRGLRAAGPVVAEAIESKSDDYMPADYERIFKAALHFKTEVRTALALSVTVVVKARGARGHDRQVEQFERGEFRRPIYAQGRRKTWRWTSQRVRAHFATEPAEGATPKVREKIDAAVGRVVAKIERA